MHAARRATASFKSINAMLTNKQDIYRTTSTVASSSCSKESMTIGLGWFLNPAMN